MRAADDSSFQFGPFVFEPGERRLLRDGHAIPLTPKAFDLLTLLVARAGRALSKDEIFEQVWPRRIVIEANLTKHIWMLRQALGEGEDRYIETVSKLGYRFIAPVTRRDAAAGPADTAQSQPVSPEAGVRQGARTERRGPRGARAWAAAGLLVLSAGAVAGTAWLALRQRNDPPGASQPPGRPVAVGPLTDLSPEQETVWIGPAVQELLSTDIALSGGLRVLPDELTRPAAAGLASPRAGGFGPGSLVVLRRRLGEALVVSGSYLVSGPQDDRAVRLDVTVQDARNGSLVATISRSGRLADLPAVVTRASADLRRALNAPHLATAEAVLAANLTPPTPDVMRHLGQGLAALRTYDPAHARDEFLGAIADAPDYAPAYVLLSQAWGALGYRGRSLASAEQAVARSGDLPRRTRLQIAAQKASAASEWPQAIQSLRSLIALDPKDPEPGLQLADVLVEANRPAEAEGALAQVRALGGPIGGDPRVDLAAARVAAARSDAPARIAHASRALALARTHDTLGLVAEAETQLGIGRSASDPRAAAGSLEQALSDYGKVGNPRGQAWVRQSLGNLYSDTDPKRALAEYKQALALSQRIGDQAGAAAAQADLAIVLWAAGDREAAETAAQQVLQLRRETGDVGGQAWALTAMAIEHSDESASDQVIADFRQAIALDEAAGARAHLAFSLFSLSDILRLRGQLPEAAATCARAQATYGQLGDPQDRGQADFECALIALDRGDLARATSGVARARAWALQHGDALTVANADLTLGQIEMGERDWPAAARHIAAAEQEFKKADIVTGHALTASLLALCESELGQPKAAAAAATEANQLRGRITERQEAFATDVALAHWRGRSGARAQAIATLDALATDAERRGWRSNALEARLAAVELSPDSTRERALLAQQARQSGFGWVLKRLG